MASESSDSDEMIDEQQDAMGRIQKLMKELQEEYEQAHMELKNTTANIEQRMVVLQSGQQQIHGKTAQMETEQGILEKSQEIIENTVTTIREEQRTTIKRMQEERKNTEGQIEKLWDTLQKHMENTEKYANTIAKDREIAVQAQYDKISTMERRMQELEDTNKNMQTHFEKMTNFMNTITKDREDAISILSALNQKIKHIEEKADRAEAKTNVMESKLKNTAQKVKHGTNILKEIKRATQEQQQRQHEQHQQMQQPQQQQHYRAQQSHEREQQQSEQQRQQRHEQQQQLQQPQQQQQQWTSQEHQQQSDQRQQQEQQHRRQQQQFNQNYENTITLRTDGYIRNYHNTMALTKRTIVQDDFGIGHGCKTSIQQNTIGYGSTCGNNHGGNSNAVGYDGWVPKVPPAANYGSWEYDAQYPYDNNRQKETYTRRLVDKKTAEKPGTFEGNDDEFIEWSEKFARFATAIIDDIMKLLEWATDKGDCYISNDIVIQWGQINNIQDAGNLSHQIWLLLNQHTTGRAKIIVERCNYNGLEAWRQLQQRHNPKTMVRQMKLLQQVNQPKACVRDESLIETVDKWEKDIMMLDKLFNVKIPDPQKITILASMCSTETARSVLDKAGSGDYEKVKKEVFDLIQLTEENKRRVKTLQGRINSIKNNNGEHGHDNEQWIDDEQWIDTNALYKSKGKKGKGKGKAINADTCARCGKAGHWASQRTMPYNGNCYICGGKGHHQNECYSSQAKSKGKGKYRSHGKKGVNMVDEEITEQENEHEAQPIGGLQYDDDEWEPWGSSDKNTMDLCQLADDGFTTIKPSRKTNNRWSQSARRELNKTVSEHTNSNSVFMTLMENDEGEINAINNMEDMAQTNAEHKCWDKVVVTVDSGASTSVMPISIASDVPTIESTASRLKTKFRAANGGIITSDGKRQINGVTADGNNVSASFEVCPVTKTLGAVSEMIDRDNKVVFDKSGSYI